MNRIFPILSATLTLAACDDGSGGDDVSSATLLEERPISDPQLAQSVERATRRPEPGGGDDLMSWNFSTAARPKLVYGEPATDNVRLMLRCDTTGLVTLSFLRTTAPDGANRMTVRSDDAVETVAAIAQPTQLEGFSVSADLPVNAAPLEQFRAGNPLRIEWSDETIAVPPAGRESERFFGTC